MGAFPFSASEEDEVFETDVFRVWGLPFSVEIASEEDELFRVWVGESGVAAARSARLRVYLRAAKRVCLPPRVKKGIQEGLLEVGALTLWIGV